MTPMPRLVLIEWEDSARPDPGWKFTSDMTSKDTSVIRCRSVGWLVRDGELVKVLAPNVAEWGSDNEQVCGEIRIPARAVTAMYQLEKGSLQPAYDSVPP